MLRLQSAELREWNAIMKHRWDNADKGQQKYLEKSVQVPLALP